MAGLAMTREDIIRMAREAGWVIYEDMPYMDVQAVQDALIERLERFAHLVYEATFRDANIAASRTILDAAVLAEREACAKVCEEFYSIEGIAQDCAAAIRARSNP